MPGTFFGLEIGRRGLQTHQRALDVTGHNLANASTEGYTRQEAVFTQTDPYTAPDLNSPATPGQLGSGITTSIIRRIRDEYMDPQFRRSNSDRYYWEDQISIFKRVEASFAEPASSGIEDQLVEFFKGWQNLNNNPQDPGVKASVKEMGVQLASLMTYTYNQLTDIQESIIKPGTLPAVESGQMKDQVARVNDLFTQIQNLTSDIMKIYRVGQQPNDLMDKRDLLLDELSKFGPLTVAHKTDSGKPTGEITMTFFGMTITSVPRQQTTLSLRINDEPGPENGHLELQENSKGKVIDLTAEIDNYQKGGSLLGLEKARQSIIGFKGNLDYMAVNLRDKIREKNNTPPAAGIPDFFMGSLAKGNFAVNNAVVSDPNIIDGTKASKIAGIRHENMDPSRNYTIEQSYGLLTTDVGNKARGTDGMAANQQAIQEQMYNLRESVSGVSVDEELSKMVQFQYGYQASARVVSMVDDLLDVLINRMT
ncbi:MAG: flagellar hook-associated protein FlgK [Actinobacteria bacterium]|nr:flagellar hook-associated protein FlgK [Actinomycetota bacterium]